MGSREARGRPRSALVEMRGPQGGYEAGGARVRGAALGRGRQSPLCGVGREDSTQVCAPEGPVGAGTRNQTGGGGHGRPAGRLHLRVGTGRLTTLFLGLVGAVPTVVLSVTLPARRDAAARVLAAELIHSAGHLGCKGRPVVRGRLLAGVGGGAGAADTTEGRWDPGAPGHSLQLAGSSLPSTQSLSRSQTQTRGMQRLVMEHWNWLGAQVTSAAEWGRE